MAIVGEKLKDYVIKQINQRQEKLGNTTKTDSDLVYFNSKTAWVKLASGNTISKIKLDEYRTSYQSNPLIEGINKGSDLAEKYVLFGGTSTFNSGTLTQRDGLSNSNSSYYTSKEFGVVPLPGIEDVSIKCLNRGSLKKSKIKIRVENKHQLEVIDLLYLRLGYTVLLEWGNSHFLDNNGQIQSTNHTLIEEEFFKNTNSKKSFLPILNKIEKKRKETFGNYDGFLAKVSNFDWSFNEDGSYSINLELISLGDVIESLKSNVILDYQTNEFIEQTTSGQSNINLNVDSIITSNKTVNTLFTILYLWKINNIDPIDWNSYDKTKGLSLTKTVDTPIIGSSIAQAYIGDVLSPPTSSTVSITSEDVVVKMEIGYYDPIAKDLIPKTTGYDYAKSRYGYFNYGEPITIEYKDKLTSIGAFDDKTIVDNIIAFGSGPSPTVPSSATFTTSSNNYNFNDFVNLLKKVDLDSFGNSQYDWENPANVDSSDPYYKKLQANVSIAGLAVQPRRFQLNSPITLRLNNSTRTYEVPSNTRLPGKYDNNSSKVSFKQIGFNLAHISELNTGAVYKNLNVGIGPDPLTSLQNLYSSPLKKSVKKVSEELYNHYKNPSPNNILILGPHFGKIDPGYFEGKTVKGRRVSSIQSFDFAIYPPKSSTSLGTTDYIPYSPYQPVYLPILLGFNNSTGYIVAGGTGNLPLPPTVIRNKNQNSRVGSKGNYTGKTWKYGVTTEINYKKVNNVSKPSNIKDFVDLPYVRVTILRGAAAGGTSTSITIPNPIRKFKEKDVVRLYKEQDGKDVFSFHMKFEALLETLKNEVVSKVKTSDPNYSDYPNIVGINNESNPSNFNFKSYMKKIPYYGTSYDLSKCLVNSTISLPYSSSAGSGASEDTLSIFSQKGDSNFLPNWEITGSTINPTSTANSMNIYLDFEFIGDVLQSNTDKNGSISIYSFIKGICDGINRSFANVNNLEPVIDETTNVLSIVDSSNNRSTGGSYELNPFGFTNNNQIGSFVRKIDLKTAITPQYASMVTVGATAGGYVKGVEATAFATWNSGIKDRYKDEFVPASEDAGVTTTNGAIEDAANYFYKTWIASTWNTLGIEPAIDPSWGENIGSVSSFFSNLFSGNLLFEKGGSVSLSQEKINKNLEIATEYFRAYSAKEKDGGSIGFIPFNVGLKMDGISGIKIYNEIILNTRFLPQNYANSLSFIVTAVNNSLKDGDWETELKLTLIPKPKTSSYNPYTAPAIVSSNNTAGTGGTTSKYTSTPVVPFTSTTLSYADTKRFLQLIISDTCLQKAVFATLYAEASKYGSGTTGGFNSAGGYNFAGVQTDNAIWGGNLNSYASKRITGQFQRVDSGGVLRWFAAFDNDTGFLEFMTNRVQNKGFDGCDGNKWVTTYINSWWSPAAKASYTVGTPTFNSKLSIFNDAITIFNSLP